MLKKYLLVFFVSMVPLIELRGAIPYSQLPRVSLPLLQAYIVAVIGNMVPVPFIYLFARRVLEWGADKPVIGKFFRFCLEKLLLFVGIPLPGTGAWTGTLAASILDMDFKSSITAVMLGVILAGIIMGAASAGLFGALGAIF